MSCYSMHKYGTIQAPGHALTDQRWSLATSRHCTRQRSRPTLPLRSPLAFLRRNRRLRNLPGSPLRSLPSSRRSRVKSHLRAQVTHLPSWLAPGKLKNRSISGAESSEAAFSEAESSGGPKILRRNRQRPRVRNPLAPLSKSPRTDRVPRRPSNRRRNPQRPPQKSRATFPARSPHHQRPGRHAAPQSMTTSTRHNNRP